MIKESTIIYTLLDITKQIRSTTTKQQKITMISINKYLVIAVVASVLLSVAFVQGAEEQTVDESTARRGGLTGLGSSLINGIKHAASGIVSHIPYFGNLATAPAAAGDSIQKTVTDTVSNVENQAETAAGAQTEETTETTEAQAAPVTEAAQEEAAPAEAAPAETNEVAPETQSVEGAQEEASAPQVEESAAKAAESTQQQ